MKRSTPILILFCTLFFIKSLIALDPDFGWHLRMGEVILKTGVPRTDPFSYTMPNYPFVDHEYLTNVFIAAAYPHIKMFGLAAVFGVLAVIPFFSFFKDRFLIPLLSLAMTVFILFVGVRPQVITWLFFWVFIKSLHKNTTGKTLLILVVLQAVWTNMHGGFFLGIIVSLLYFFADAIEKRKISFPLLVYIVALLLVTGVNPYGYRVWWEVGMQLSDPYLRWSIQEWLPAFALIDITYWVYVGISAGFFIRYHRGINLFEKLTYLLFLVAGLLSMRNIPLWILASLPVLQRGVSSLNKDVPKTYSGKKMLKKFHRIVAIGAGVVVCIQLAINGYSLVPYIKNQTYPDSALRYIRKEKLQGNIFAAYGWGGYLIWKLPEKKVFIDGRMPSWRFRQDDPRLSGYAFKDYSTILNEKKGYEKLVAKYNITYLLLMNEKDRRKTPQRFSRMKKIYEDSVAVIYKTGIPPKSSFFTSL